MGLPTTWTILSLVHLFWMDVVKKSLVGRDRKAHRFSICGDDALLATTVGGAAVYRAIVEECGGEVSPGKHFECSNPTLRGVFLEKLFEFQTSNGKIFGGCRYPAIPVKGFTSRNLPRDFTEGNLISCRSFGVRQIMVVDALASQSQCLIGPLKDYVMRRASWLQTYATQVIGLALGHPLRLGGYVLGRRSVESDALALQVRDSGRNFSLEVKRTLDPSWRMAAGFSAEGRALAVKNGQLVDLGVVSPDLCRLNGKMIAPYRKEDNVYTEEQRLMATTLGMFAQCKGGFGYTEKDEVYEVRAADFKRQLTKLRKLGRLKPSPVPLADKHTKQDFLIAWIPTDDIVSLVGTGPQDWTIELGTLRRDIYQLFLKTYLIVLEEESWGDDW